MKITNCIDEQAIDEKYGGRFQVKIRVWDKITGTFDEFMNYGSTEEIAIKRTNQEAKENGYHKGLSNGTTTIYKWYKSEQAYIFKRMYSY